MCVILYDKNILIFVLNCRIKEIENVKDMRLKTTQKVIENVLNINTFWLVEEEICIII